MNVGAFSSQQLRSLVEDKWQRDEGAVAVGLHVSNSWNGPSEVEFDFGKARVVRADTVFQVRQALSSAERSEGRIILLTKLQQGDLGNDVVARLARSRLFAVDHWASLCALFKAKELDRSICDPALAQALLEYAPPDGYPPVSAGILDAGTVWRAISRHVFDMGESEPDLVSLVLWASTKAGPTRYLGVAEELRASLRQRLMNSLGDAADSLLRFMDSGAGADALALAAVCQVVFGSGDEKTLDAAAARMEQYHRHKPISQGVGRALGRIAADAIADLDRKEDPRFAGKHLDRADELLRQFRCDDHAYRNRLTLLGYEQRLARFGVQIEAVLDAPGEAATETCEKLRQEVATHRIAKLGRRLEQVSRTEMALRLVRWLTQPVPPATSFAEMVNAYRKELAFVDWARESICRGEDVAGLSRAYQRLDQAVLARRQEFNRTFAQSLAGWTSVGSALKDVCGVEDVLSRVVARVAGADNRVLLIVLDGMSWAVCHELLEDVRRDHWFEATPDESSSPPVPVIAAIPSVTSYSRTSLLSGRLEKGDASAEKRNFEAHPSLKLCCDKRYPPVLFHKKEVSEGARGALGDDLSRAILSPNSRVVGVVINAIDDFLSKGDQMPMLWTIGRISPLGSLLKLARDSGRVVVLVSDHGHVWHRPDAKSFSSDEGSRWRAQKGEVRDGEMLLAGGRVRDEKGQQTAIAPWVETIYYGRQQNGYHGGITPQEMICPLVLLTDKSSAYSGLYPCEYPKPEWWSSAPTAKAAGGGPPVSVAVPKGQATLFDHMGEGAEKPAPPVPSKSWIGRLLASEAYKNQKDLVRRHAPEDDVVRRCLEALDGSGGIMTPTAFSKAADVPAARLDGLIARIQRLLNVDGYETLTLSRNENRIGLNVGKLKRQFDLECAMDISRERRREIIAALRKGTVPQRGLDFLAVGLGRFESVLSSELANVAQGSSVFKAVRGDYGCGKTFFGRWVQENAKKSGFATAEVQISETETPLHRLETVYRRAMEQLSTADCFLGAFRSIIDGWFYGLEEDVLAEGTTDPSDDAALASRADDLLEQRLVEITRATPQFAAALRTYRTAQRQNDHATAEGLAGWLAGQPHVAASIKRVAGIKGDVDHFAALSFLRGLLLILKDSGYSGLVLVLDEIETLQRVRGDVREKGLNALRQLIDDIDGGRFPNLFLLTTGTPAFFDGPQGVQRLEPLAQRLHVDFQTDARFDNPRAVQLRLPSFDHARLLEVGVKVRDLFVTDCSSPERVRSRADDGYIEALARAVAGKLGGKVGIAPRLFLKKLVADVLDRIDQFGDFDPTRHYQLTVSASEMTPVEREAQAVSVDDIEMDV